MDEPRDDLVVPREVVVPRRTQLIEGRLLLRAHRRGVDRVEPVVDALLRLQHPGAVVGVGGERDLGAVGGDVGEDQALPSGDIGDLEARGLRVGEHAVDRAELLGQVALLADGGQSRAGTDEHERADGTEGDAQPAADAQVGEAVQVHEGTPVQGTGTAALRPFGHRSHRRCSTKRRRCLSPEHSRRAATDPGPQHLVGSPSRHCRLAAPSTIRRAPGNGERGGERTAAPARPGRRVTQ